MALEDWVVKGIAPPPSRVPSLAQGTAVPAAGGRHARDASGMVLPPGDNPITEPVDWVNPPETDGAGVGRPLGVPL